MVRCESDLPPSPQGERERRQQRLEAIWLTVAAIPEGRVSAYGDVARMAGMAGHSRYVGYALGQLSKGSAIPWHRVINSAGKVSFRPGSEAFERQRKRLQEEGVVVQEDGRLPRFRFIRWQSPG